MSHPMFEVIRHLSLSSGQTAWTKPNIKFPGLMSSPKHLMNLFAQLAMYNLFGFMVMASACQWETPMFAKTPATMWMHWRGVCRGCMTSQGYPDRYLLLDNTAWDNKNSKMLRFWLKLTALGVIDTCNIGFPIKGHTRTCLDAVGGQAVTRCSHETFETAQELVEVYQRFLDDASLETSCYFRKAWKHDSSPEWDKWLEEIPVTLTGLTGPKAPHLFRILKRKMLSMKDLDSLQYEFAPGHPEDILLLCHMFESSPKPFQAEVAIRAESLPGLISRLTWQPSGEHPRRHVAWKIRNEVKVKADAAFAKHLELVLSCFFFVTKRITDS